MCRIKAGGALIDTHSNHPVILHVSLHHLEKTSRIVTDGTTVELDPCIGRIDGTR